MLGIQYKTNKDSVITVVGNYEGILEVECSVCSQDKELFPEVMYSDQIKLKKE